MLRTIVLMMLTGLLAVGLAAVPSQAGKPNKRIEEPDDATMGEYVGQWRPAGGKAVEALARVIGEGDGKYRVRLFTSHAWSSKFGELEGTAKDKRVELTGKVGDADGKGTIEGGEVLVAKSSAGEFEGKYNVRKSPTEGQKPPAGAVVLLPYAPGKKTNLEEWSNQKWKIMDDGSALVQGGGNVSKRNFGSIKLHVEFWCPYQPKARGQGRGNSGVYLHGKYEVQVLDSFGLQGRHNECGGIYTVADPRVNAALPPTRWQTYDVIFRKPMVDNDGNYLKPAYMTVRHNGILIHEKVSIKKTTTAGLGGKPRMAGPLMLQDHGNPVRFRNIWYVPLKD